MNFRKLCDKYEKLLSDPNATEEDREQLGIMFMAESIGEVLEIFKGEPADYKSSKTK